MSQSTSRALCTALIAAIGISACHRPTSTTSTTSCASILYGYSADVISGTTTPDSLTKIGIIDAGTDVLAPMATAINTTYTNQGTYNPTDGCYYVFKSQMGSGASTGTLYKVDGATVASFTGPANNAYGLTYNPVNNKFYCASYASGGGSISEVALSGSTYSLNSPVSTVHPAYGLWEGGNTTVDEVSGTIYYITGDTATQYIERYTPGGTPSVVTAITGSWVILGLRYNATDHHLYALKEIYPSATMEHDLIRIDPSSGTVNTLGAIPFHVNSEFYSACADPCTNEYILSTPSHTTAGLPATEIGRFNTSGTMVQHHITPGIYQALAIKH